MLKGKIMSSDKVIWEAILDVTKDKLQAAVRCGQNCKAERLKKIVKLLCDMPEDKK